MFSHGNIIYHYVDILGGYEVEKMRKWKREPHMLENHANRIPESRGFFMPIKRDRPEPIIQAYIPWVVNLFYQFPNMHPRVEPLIKWLTCIQYLFFVIKQVLFINQHKSLRYTAKMKNQLVINPVPLIDSSIIESYYV